MAVIHGRNRTHARNAESALRYTRCRVFETTLSGQFSRRTCQLSANGWNWTRASISDGVLRHMCCRDRPVGTFLTKVPLSTNRGRFACETPPPIYQTVHIRRAIVSQKAHGQRRKRLRDIRPKLHLPVGQSGQRYRLAVCRANGKAEGNIFDQSHKIALSDILDCARLRF